jgi:hypothetical protein
MGCLEVQYLEDAGGAGGGGASSTGGSEVDGGGGATTNEICGNGVDDDRDDLTDCDDAECAMICGSLPDGWTGFVSVRPEGCAVDEALAQVAYVSATSGAGCTCGCGAPTCGTVTASAYGGNGCSGGVLSETLPDGACVTVGNNGAQSVRATVMSSCGAPTASLPAVESSSVALCTDEDGACVFRSGADVACPPGFPLSSQYHATVEDGRSCATSKCSCTSPVCGTVASYSFLCMGSGVPLPFSSCEETDGPASLIFTADPDPSCTPGGTSAVEGELKLGSPITVCCQ